MKRLKRCSCIVVAVVLILTTIFSTVGAKPVEAANVCTRDDGTWLFPVQNMTISDWAGCTTCNKCQLCGKAEYCKFHGINNINYGIDIPVNKKPVYAASDGYVYYHEGEDKNRGIYAIVEYPIDKTWSYYSLYQHLGSVNKGVHPADSKVSAGDVIATSGNTGYGSGPHLHFEVFIAKRKQGPKLAVSLSVENGYSKSYLKTPGLRNGLIITNPSSKTKGMGYSDDCQANVTKAAHRGSITYVTDKKKVSIPGEGLGNKSTTVTQNFNTGTYQVGATFPNMKEKRIIRTGKGNAHPAVIELPAGAKVYVRETYKGQLYGKVEYKANNKTYSGYLYIANKTGMQTFDYKESSDTTPKAITSAPTIIAVGDTNVAANKSLSFKWGSVANAASYTVNVRKNGVLLYTTTTTGTSFSYTFKETGTYSVSVKALNSAFWSADSSAISVKVHEPVTVKFVDYDGKVLSTQVIDYGADAKAPSAPNSRTGYVFAGWNRNYRGVKGDTIVTATYEIKSFRVRFFDGNAKQIGNTQTVKYNESATAPDVASVAVKEGYTFVNWDKDYSKITGDTDVYAVTSWANKDLPITILSGTKAVQNIDDGVVASYTISATLRNINTEATTGRAIVALTTKDGNLLTATESGAFTVTNGKDYSLSVTVPYTGQATNAEIYIVNGYQYTSNHFEDGTIPISNKVSVTCEKAEEALAYADWTTSAPPSGAIGVQSKKQYASRPITTTVEYKHVFYPNSWSAYTTSVLTASDTRKVTSKTQYQYRDVGAYGSELSTTTKPTASTLLKINSSSTAYYYFHYTNMYTNGTYGVDSVSSGGTIKKNYGKCVYKRSSKLTQTKNYGDIGGKTQYYISTGCSKLSGVTSRSGNCGNPGWCLWYYDKAVTTYKYQTRSWGAWSAWQDSAVASSDTRQVNTRKVYAYKDANIVYSTNPDYVLSGYTRDSRTVNKTTTSYGTWGSWQDNAITANATTDVQTRTVYRWKTKEEIESGDEVEGKTKIVKGTVPTSFAGKQAILFVYKNADASDYTTEYLGQTTIGADGSYYFEFVTREEPSVETGDFSATLGIEGTDTVFVLDESNYDDPNQFKAPLAEYTVEFVDNDGNLLSTQKVKKGGTAVVPENVPDIEGYTFTGWNTNVTSIQGNYTVAEGNPIQAQYKINEYDVLYIDWTTDEYETATFEYGATLTAPTTLKLESTDESKDKIWNHAFDGTERVTGDMVVTASEKMKMFTVQYYNLDGSLYASESVKYGDSVALLDSHNLSDEYMFVYGWKLTVDDSELKCVTQNIEAYPEFAYYDSSSVPEADVESGAYTNEQKVILSTDDADADIYYTIDGSDPKDHGILYHYPISIDETCVLRTYATKEKTNDSPEAIYYYAINKADIADSEWYLLEDLPDEVVDNEDRYQLESKIGYRYDMTKQVLSDEEATALINEGWQQVGETAYTAWSDYVSELPDNIGEAEVEETTDTEGNPLYRYRYGVWTFSGKSPWQTTKPTDVEYEMQTIYRYQLPKQCVLTLEMQGEPAKKLFVYLNELLEIDLSQYLSEGEQCIGLYKDSEYTEKWDLEQDVVTDSMTLYLAKETKQLTVNYYDMDGALLQSDKVYYGRNACDIEAPVVEGYVFTGWDKSLNNIKVDTDFYAQYVPAEEAKQISLNAGKKSLFTSTNYQLIATVDGENEYEGIVWTSSVDNIASVNSNGLVTAVHAGTARITATLPTGERASCDITVIGDEDYELLLNTLSEYEVNRDRDALIMNQTVTAGEIKEQFVNKGTIVVDAEGNELTDVDIVTTACAVKGEYVDDRLEVVVLGDVNADSYINELDYEAIEKMIMYGEDEVDIGLARYLAADINQDVYIDDLDLAQLEDIINGMSAVVLETNNASWGQVTGAGSFAIGSEVTVCASPLENVTFKGWYDAGGELLSTDLSYTFALKDDIVLKAVFENSVAITSVQFASETVALKPGEVYTLGATILPANTTLDKTLVWKSSDSNVATVVDGMITAVAAGTATITATTINGKVGSCTVTVWDSLDENHTHSYKPVVIPATDKADGKIEWKCDECGNVEKTEIIGKIASVALKKSTVVYNGKAQKPVVIIKDVNGNVISPDNYVVSVVGKCKEVGCYTVNIVYQNQYGGNSSATFTIKPKATSISKLTAKNNGMTVTWKKQSAQTTGYQIQYGTNSKFTGAKTVTVGKNKTISKTISKLKAKKKYYVRVRTYKTVKVNGKKVKIYSDWSKIKSVTMKK